MMRRVLTGLLTVVTFAEAATSNELPADADPPEVTTGERLFLETRFSQFFFARSQGNANAVLTEGDLTMDVTETTGVPLPGPFAGQSMNCRACHLVDEHAGIPGGGNRTYADFAHRSPLPVREDGKVTTPRNSPPLVNAFLSRKNFLLHFDGEFRTVKDLVKGTVTGRNFGWLPGEEQQAIAHIAHIIRNDDGSGALAQEFGGPYRVILKGTDPSIPPELRLPKKFRIDVTTASDATIFDTVAALVEAYVTSLEFIRDGNGEFDGSPYDVFLRKNGLPRQPARVESDLEYSRHLLRQIESLTDPTFVVEPDGAFTTHEQDFAFGAQELAGLKIFLRELPTVPPSPTLLTQGQIGNCAACHAAPNFTDFAFHSTGVTQEEYDTIHGLGTFAALFIPDLETRRANHDMFLPPTPKHPNARGPFLAVPSIDRLGYTDLGLWNVFANPDSPRPQRAIRRLLFTALGKPIPAEKLLPKTIAAFKTPGLRDLAHSAPYFHTGGKDTLTDVIQFYLNMSSFARADQVRNGDPALKGIALTASDIAPLRAFLRALNEDYE